MEQDEITTKLRGLRNNIKNWLEYRDEFNRPTRYFVPQIVLDLFHRCSTLRDVLRSEYPSLFNDLPVRKLPKHNETTDRIERTKVELLLKSVDYCLDILSGMTMVVVPSMKVTREGVFFAGQYFDALQRVAEILSSAKQSIVVIDAYINEEVLDLLTSKDSAVEVKILTKNVLPTLIAEATAFNKQYEKLLIRESQVFHDRFLIVDDKDFYHFGASNKDLSNKGFMFSCIEESIVINSLRKEFAQEWAKAKVAV